MSPAPRPPNSPRPSHGGPRALVAAAPPSLVLDDADVRALGDGHALVRDGLLGADLARSARAEVLTLWQRGALTPAAVGRAHAREARPDIRSDLTAWLDPSPELPALAAVHALFAATLVVVNEAAWMGLGAFDLQVALYPGAGAAYLRHRDTFRDRPERRLTAIWYANPDWEPADGGLLRAYEPTGPRDIAPLADRLVLFRSDVLEHAVTPSHTQRVALTAWYRPL